MLAMRKVFGRDPTFFKREQLFRSHDGKLRLRTSQEFSHSAAMELKAYLAARQKEVDRALDHFLPSESTKPKTIHKAMRYSIFAGGKRLRPILFLAAGETGGGGKKAPRALPLPGGRIST